MNKNLIKMNQNSVYLKQGAGLWKWEKNEDSEFFKISDLCQSDSC